MAIVPYYYFFLLSTLCAAVLATWSPHIRIDDNCQTELKRATMFIDQKSKVTHYFWCQYYSDNYRFRLLYRKQDQAGELSPVQTLDTEHDCEEISVTGINDGMTINVAYEADRSIAHTRCSAEMTEGCLDIYYFDSKDGGETWSKPQAVGKADMNDIWNRAYPRIVVSPLTGRSWIFYVLTNVESTIYSIGWVTRPADSLIYTSETLLGFRKELIMGITVALSNYRGSFLIHIVWTGEFDGRLVLIQGVSPNNGITWTVSEFLGRGFAGKFTSNILMDQQYMILPYLEYSYAPSRLAITPDRTNNWKLREISENSGIPDVALCYKTSKADAILFTLLNAQIDTNQYEGEFGYMRLSDETFIRGDNPFGSYSMAYDPNIRCYVGNDDAFVVKALGILNSAQLLLTQNVIS